MKIIKKILLLLLVAFVIAQFFGPEKNESDIASINAFFEDTNPPEDVKIILKESCMDCHSSFSRYPWYSAITPVNYWMDEHIKNGSKHFNMSKWADAPIKRKDHKFEELIEMIEKKEMPLPSYLWTHTDAKLSDDQMKAIVDWAKLVRAKYSLEPRPQ